MTQTPGETPTLTPSRHNIIGPVHRSDSWFIVNPLSREADLLSAEEAGQISLGTVADPDEWVAKGYLVDEDEEQRRYRQAYLDFTANRERDEVQIFFVPWYACNFACHYCYQAPYENPQSPLDPKVIDAFFDYVQKTFAGRSKYITLFGGEPLL
ncbi:MAG TPA: radical SAM protein, partial [Stenomitos sp.]